MNDFSGRGQLEDCVWRLLDFVDTNMYTFAVINYICEYNAIYEFCWFLCWIIQPKSVLGIPSNLKSMSEMRVILRTPELCLSIHKYLHTLWLSWKFHAYFSFRPTYSVFIPFFSNYMSSSHPQLLPMSTNVSISQNFFSSRKSEQPIYCLKVYHSPLILSNSVILWPSTFL